MDSAKRWLVQERRKVLLWGLKEAFRNLAFSTCSKDFKKVMKLKTTWEIRPVLKMKHLLKHQKFALFAQSRRTGSPPRKINCLHRTFILKNFRRKRIPLTNEENFIHLVQHVVRVVEHCVIKNSLVLADVLNKY